MLPTTSSMLLAALKDPADEPTWREFDERYRGVLFAFARRMELSEADAEELAQEVLANFAQEYREGRYDRDRGRLRSWLFCMAHARVQHHRRRVAQRAGWRSESALADVPDDTDSSSELWNREWREAVLLEGLRQLRESTQLSPATLRAFEGIALEGRDGAQLARELGMNKSAVYQAKYRAMGLLREILGRLEEDW